MSRHPLRTITLLALAATGLLGACSDDPSTGAQKPPVGPGVAGSGGQANAGAAGETGSAGRASGGAPTVGGASGTGASSGAGQGGAGGAAGAGPAGNGGKSGAPAYPSDLNPGPNVIPTDCRFAHGRTGCCGPDGNAYYVERDDLTFEVQKDVCDLQHPCRWATFQARFACGGDADGHPYGVPSSCGAPAYPSDCLNSCVSDDDCKPEVWGEGVRCYRPHPEATGSCVRCVTGADCPDGTFCDPDGGHYCRKKKCTSDAQCQAADERFPACSPWAFTCVDCRTDAQCKGPGMGCFGGSCFCKTDVACATSPLGHRCDLIERACGCQTSADCPSESPLCISQTCSKCYDDDDCAQSAGKPYCVIEGLGRACVACRKDTDCPSSAPRCSSGACEPGCSSSFGCGGATPVCEGTVCIAPPSCADDDAAEPADDSPLTTSSTLIPGAARQGKVCGLPGERDHFRITVSSTSDIVLELQSADPRVFVALSDDQGRLLALSMHGAPQRLQARALRAGTYYAAVGVVTDGDPAASTYTLAMQTGGVPCTSDASCADATATEVYRGRCDAPSGACVFIEGNRSLAAAEPCDDDGDCATGFCSGYLFSARPGTRSRCSAPCDGPTGLGSAPLNELCAAAGLDATWVCTTFEDTNRCLPRCQTDEDCPLVDLIAAPPPGKPWLHMTCSQDGHCEHYE